MLLPCTLSCGGRGPIKDLPWYLRKQRVWTIAWLVHQESPSTISASIHWMVITQFISILHASCSYNCNVQLVPEHAQKVCHLAEFSCQDDFEIEGNRRNTVSKGAPKHWRLRKKLTSKGAFHGLKVPPCTEPRHLSLFYPLNTSESLLRPGPDTSPPLLLYSLKTLALM